MNFLYKPFKTCRSTWTKWGSSNVFVYYTIYKWT